MVDRLAGGEKEVEAGVEMLVIGTGSVDFGGWIARAVSLSLAMSRFRNGTTIATTLRIAMARATRWEYPLVASITIRIRVPADTHPYMSPGLCSESMVTTVKTVQLLKPSSN